MRTATLSALAMAPATPRSEKSTPGLRRQRDELDRLTRERESE